MNKKELLETLDVALSDWLNTYASEFADKKNVKEAFNRIKNNGGTLGYIADLRRLINDEINNEQNIITEVVNKADDWINGCTCGYKMKKQFSFCEMYGCSSIDDLVKPLRKRLEKQHEQT